MLTDEESQEASTLCVEGLLLSSFLELPAALDLAIFCWNRAVSPVLVLKHGALSLVEFINASL